MSGRGTVRQRSPGETDLYPIIMLALATGCRRNELLALRWRDIDFENAAIAVVASVVHLEGETTRKSTKNGKGRTVPVPESVIAELRRLRRDQAEKLLHLGVRQTPDVEVFRRGSDGEIRTPLSLTNAFARLVNRAGLPRVTFHALRHTHASELLAAGVSVNVAAERLGHSDGGTLLLRTYAHANEEMHREAARKVEAILGFSS